MKTTTTEIATAAEAALIQSWAAEMAELPFTYTPIAGQGAYLTVWPDGTVSRDQLGWAVIECPVVGRVEAGR